jgi:tetratricopeptide (TPR) repeat protein
MKSAAVSDAEAQAYLGDLLYHSNRLTEAETHLRNALKLDPDSGMAQTALGLVYLRRQNFIEAEKYLEKAVQTDSGNYWVHYNYAYVLSNEGMSEFGFVSEYSAALADKMRKALKKAIELNPNFAESYSLYAFVNIIRMKILTKRLRISIKRSKSLPAINGI